MTKVLPPETFGDILKRRTQLGIFQRDGSASFTMNESPGSLTMAKGWKTSNRAYSLRKIKLDPDQTPITDIFKCENEVLDKENDQKPQNVRGGTSNDLED